MTIEAGQQLLHYRLIEKIGEGGTGVVWKAEDTKLQRHGIPGHWWKPWTKKEALSQESLEKAPL